MAATTSCILCGVRIAHTAGSSAKRKRTLSSLGQFVSLRCQPTPYAYQFFSGVSGEDYVLLCISCVNWQRRGAGKSKRVTVRARKRPLLFIDQFTLFMLRPGTVLFPDQRCVLRLLHSLKKGDGERVAQMLLGLLPVPVQAMVLSIDLSPFTLPEGAIMGALPEGAVLHTMVLAWWQYNGRTTFFSNHLTAKLVRRVAKAEREEASRVLTELVADDLTELEVVLAGM